MDKRLALSIALLAVICSFATFVIADSDDSDAATVSVGNGETKTFNFSSDFGWSQEPHFEESDLQVRILYTNLISGKSESVSGTIGNWSATFKIPVLAKVGTATAQLDAVNPENGDILDSYERTITITDKNGQGTQSSPLASVDYFVYSSQGNPSSSTMNIYVKSGASFRVSESFYASTSMTAIGSSTSVSSLNGIVKTSSSGRDTYSGTLNGDVCIKFNSQYTLNFRTVGGSTPSTTEYTCYLYYDANGGSGAPSTQSYTGTSTSSHTFTVSSAQPTRSGYTFLGWSTSSSATSATYSGGDSISVTYKGTKTLYAVWQQNVTNYQITIYKGNWDSFKLLSVDSERITSSSKTYTIASGTTIDVDWYGKSAENGSGSNYIYTTTYSSSNYDMASSLYGTSLGDSVTVTKKASYYPAVQMTSETVYTYNYTIKYNANGGSGAPGDTTTTSTSSSKTITLSSTQPTRSGYQFLGWSKSSTASSATYSAGSSYSFDYGSTQLYAVWKQLTITVSGTPDQYAVVGNYWSFSPTVSVSGCSVSISGASWLSSTGTTVSGTPTQTGEYNITLTFSKSGYTSATKTFTVTVISSLEFTSSPNGGAIIYAI